FLAMPFVYAKTAGGKLSQRSPDSSHWITHPNADVHAYGVFHFRKKLILDKKPDAFIIHVSADQRYRLYINEKAVAAGPARSDVAHWRYETLDIAAQLTAGENIIAAVVWNDGENSAWAQLTEQTGLWMQGASAREEIINTNTSWKVTENTAYTPLASIAHITGAFEQIFAARYPWGWQSNEYDDSNWGKAKLLDENKSKRKLIARNIPMPEEKLQRFEQIRNFRGIAVTNDNFIKGNGSIKIHPWADVTILLDQQFLTTAYIHLLLSGGLGAKITVTYAESLFDKNGNKQNRNTIEGKDIKGDKDVFILDGGTDRSYNTLYYRTFRYVELRIENHQQALEIKDFYGTFTAYPFEEKASFASSNPLLNNIWDVGWRTARLCAFETYMDCPYYEQLQYVGDTRIQALISLYVSGDERLMRNAIEQINYSLLPEGITQSRYPSNNPQIIPPFSLFWITMLHDFWMHRSDDEFVTAMLPSVKKILDWHYSYLIEN
ncbi:MAG: alpha-L-rhamnosidase N-terminal domain-containing protein, partial [Chitinophagaceae bacterium]